ncbi:MAG: hypothetical protein ACJA02_000841 [Myxococcota bacterium]|jgi:hypothetical protein
MLKINLKTIIIILLAYSSFSCRFTARPAFREPSKFFKKDLKNASPDFKQGWEDGCESGMSGGSTSFNQNFYQANKQDGYKFSYSPDYKTAWGSAFWFCYRSDSIDQKSTTFNSLFRGLN